MMHRRDGRSAEEHAPDFRPWQQQRPALHVFQAANRSGGSAEHLQSFCLPLFSKVETVHKRKTLQDLTGPTSLPTQPTAQPATATGSLTSAPPAQSLQVTGSGVFTFGPDAMSAFMAEKLICVTSQGSQLSVGST